MTYGIWCRVSGGVTGSRQAWLKDNGKVVQFDTLELAQAEASRLMANVSSRSGASFSYTAKEYAP